tara:strand:- start:3166 stop:5094 length:1929 start_codon:yes stop_codon:yes gene_type:complete
MKRIITLFFAFSLIAMSFGQSSSNITAKKMKSEPRVQSQVNFELQPRAIDCIWESDFTDASEWVTDHDANDCSLDWEIGQDLECGGFYPIDAIDSADGYYAMLDSDEYGGEEGGTETEDSWLTMANPVDCSNYNNVIVEFDTWYQSYSTERCFLVVSTDGTFPTNLDPTTEADPANGIYELFPDISGEVQSNTGNPATRRINITEAAAGQSQVWVRFNWTGTWGYAWFIDRVCVAEQPADDISLDYGVVSHNGTGEEYGRVPTGQIGNTVNCAGQVFNFGYADQTNVMMSMDVVDESNYNVASVDFGEDDMYGLDTEGYLDLSTTISGPVATDQIVYFSKDVGMSPTPGVYTATFTASSDGDNENGESFGDNSAVREFAFTDNIYSSDGLGVYSNADYTRMGTGSFLDGSDGFMMMSYYDISAGTNVAGVTIMLDSYGYSTPATVAGGELVVAIRDTSLLSSESFDPTDVIDQTDFYLVTDSDVANGFITVPFSSPVYLSPNAYYISVEMYSNGNESDIYILDDETVPQPSYLSMIYIPGDQVYSNGNAAAIRLITGESVGVDENKIAGLNIYPNPSNGMLNIELDEQGQFNLEINDMLGKVVCNKSISSNTMLDLTDLDKGIYFVKLSNSAATQTTKVIIE